MIEFEVQGSWTKTMGFLEHLSSDRVVKQLEKYGQRGVAALASATPRLTGATAASWDYHVEHKPGKYELVFTNSNVTNGVNIAVILQYGHGTGTGGYVAGRDYINPAIQPVFDDIVDSAWKELTSG